MSRLILLILLALFINLDLSAQEYAQPKHLRVRLSSYEISGAPLLMSIYPEGEFDPWRLRPDWVEAIRFEFRKDGKKVDIPCRPTKLSFKRRGFWYGELFPAIFVVDSKHTKAMHGSYELRATLGNAQSEPVALRFTSGKSNTYKAERARLNLLAEDGDFAELEKLGLSLLKRYSGKDQSSIVLHAETMRILGHAYRDNQQFAKAIEMYKKLRTVKCDPPYDDFSGSSVVALGLDVAVKGGVTGEKHGEFVQGMPIVYRIIVSARTAEAHRKLKNDGLLTAAYLLDGDRRWMLVNVPVIQRIAPLSKTGGGAGRGIGIHTVSAEDCARLPPGRYGLLVETSGKYTEVLFRIREPKTKADVLAIEVAKAWVAWQKKDWKECIKLSEEALRQSRRASDGMGTYALVVAARAYRATLDLVRAKSLFTEYLRLYPDDKAVQQELRELLQNAGK